MDRNKAWAFYPFAQKMCFVSILCTLEKGEEVNLIDEPIICDGVGRVRHGVKANPSLLRKITS